MSIKKTMIAVIVFTMFGVSSGGAQVEDNAIYGVAVATEGGANESYFDITFLDALVVAGNNAEHGIKTRFNHPAGDGKSFGTLIGYMKNFRREGGTVLADLYFLDTARHSPSGNLVDYVMRLAREAPFFFGASIVYSFTVDSVRPDGLKIVRLTKLWSVDIVDDPASNPGGLLWAR